MIGLGVLTHQHFEALEADFQREYQIDLRNALWGKYPLGLRRIMVLIRGLSPQSAIGRSITGGQVWTSTEELLACIAEELDIGNRMYYQSHTKKGTKSWKPLKIARPGQRIKPPDQETKRDSVLKSERLRDPMMLSRFFGRHGKVVVE